MNRRVALALVGVLVVACHACAPHRPRNSVIAYPAAGPAQVDRGHLVYQATLEDGSRVRRFRLAVALLRPGRFRLEFLAPMGGPRAIIASDGKSLQAAFPPQRIFAEAPATPEKMEILLGLPLGPDEFLGLLTGSPSSSVEPGPRPRPGGGSIQLIYQFDESLRVRQAQVKVMDAAGSVSLYTVEYLDPWTGPWGVQARQIRLLHADRVLTLRLKSASRKHPAAEAFQVRVPARFKQVPLHELPAVGGLLFDDGGAP